MSIKIKFAGVASSWILFGCTSLAPTVSPSQIKITPVIVEHLADLKTVFSYGLLNQSDKDICVPSWNQINPYNIDASRMTGFYIVNQGSYTSDGGLQGGYFIRIRQGDSILREYLFEISDRVPPPVMMPSAQVGAMDANQESFPERWNADLEAQLSVEAREFVFECDRIPESMMTHPTWGFPDEQSWSEYRRIPNLVVTTATNGPFHIVK